MTNPDYTHIFTVIDRSGSMMALAEESESALRAMLKEQTELPGQLTVTITQFDDRYEEIASFTADPIEALYDWHLVPRGTTALLDAIGRTVTTVGEALAAMPEDERPGKVVGIIITDGFENASQDWTPERIKELIEQQQDKYGWEFVYTAANQDAITVGGSMGFRNSMNFAPTAKGANSAYDTVNSTLRAYRTNAVATMAVPVNATDEEEE